MLTKIVSTHSTVPGIVVYENWHAPYIVSLNGATVYSSWVKKEAQNEAHRLSQCCLTGDWRVWGCPILDAKSRQKAGPATTWALDSIERHAAKRWNMDGFRKAGEEAGRTDTSEQTEYLISQGFDAAWEYANL